MDCRGHWGDTLGTGDAAESGEDTPSPPPKKMGEAARVSLRGRPGGAPPLPAPRMGVWRLCQAAASATGCGGSVPARGCVRCGGGWEECRSGGRGGGCGPGPWGSKPRRRRCGRGTTGGGSAAAAGACTRRRLGDVPSAPGRGVVLGTTATAVGATLFFFAPSPLPCFHRSLRMGGVVGAVGLVGDRRGGHALSASDLMWGVGRRG